ncbi:MAG: nucleoside-diphosphate sugar epimerase [Bacteroidetes bacterium]|nr:nucleoside-diphosphate sugar epimerase [Bacteroidota bacterium]MBU1373107.1 nucleoside-diphosphate sugar epimerase [Bacteroidota bacterium]MBU1484289.1 nucleoside-diphosphate sugar epimerase [Bacteroidota bacterium]MBU1762191.1 nucleoside-diphosphate sugar epimerase [Bacteroidota bacterium]MBU2045794.1 nucleoside-diphosphate sugar epimerase [Bacteroidota bacterium]
MSNKKSIILGASGLIGSKLLLILLENENYSEVKIFIRKLLPIEHPNLIQIITDFDHLEMINSEINSHVIFCCLGSTKKKTPDLTEYRKIDHDYPLYFAKQGLKSELIQYHIVSALGANAQSSNFYTKMKGETEDDLKELGIPALYIYQPSFLEGNRKENRPLEKIMMPIMKLVNILLVGGLRKYQSISAKSVAKAMLNESIKNKSGIFVLESDKIKELA